MQRQKDKRKVEKRFEQNMEGLSEKVKLNKLWNEMGMGYTALGEHKLQDYFKNSLWLLEGDRQEQGT